MIRSLLSRGVTLRLVAFFAVATVVLASLNWNPANAMSEEEARQVQVELTVLLSQALNQPTLKYLEVKQCTIRMEFLFREGDDCIADTIASGQTTIIPIGLLSDAVARPTLVRLNWRPEVWMTIRPEDQAYTKRFRETHSIDDAEERIRTANNLLSELYAALRSQGIHFENTLVRCEGTRAAGGLTSPGLLTIDTSKNNEIVDKIEYLIPYCRTLFDE